ncbi:hypothetical protein HWV62_12829 [Athelia sp. TMB]|nr:hypothetical protein HWV62_12829 [Athelia sp. TMB]
MPPAETLNSIDAFFLDAFGTCTDWHSTVPRELKTRAPHLSDSGAQCLQSRNQEVNHAIQTHKPSPKSGARTSSKTRTHTLLAVPPAPAADLACPILDAMLASPRWSALGAQWDAQAREGLNLVWHRLDGWPDASRGLYGMKAKKLLVVLSNGNIRLLADMVRQTFAFAIKMLIQTCMFRRDTPTSRGTWSSRRSSLAAINRMSHQQLTIDDTRSSSSRNEKVYKAAIHHLSLQPSKIAMVAAHIFDLRGAARCGMKTIYVRRSSEDANAARDVKSKDEGGEFDIVVDDLVELAGMLDPK